jgi:hypothetical protein
MTLIEVVAGMALLGGLLSGVLVAYGRHVCQVRRAQLRIEAATAADRLLAGWFSGAEDGVRRHGSGRVPGKTRLRWRTHLLEDARVEGATGIQVVRLEIFEESKTLSEEKIEPLVFVDLAFPQGEDPPEKPLVEDDPTEDGSLQKDPR